MRLANYWRHIESCVLFVLYLAIVFIFCQDTKVQNVFGICHLVESISIDLKAMPAPCQTNIDMYFDMGFCDEHKRFGSSMSFRFDILPWYEIHLI